jgi:hypothetical protein
MAQRDGGDMGGGVQMEECRWRSVDGDIGVECRWRSVDGDIGVECRWRYRRGV